MKYEYLSDPNEAEDAADYYTGEFRKRGVADDEPLRLVVYVSRIPKAKLAAVEADVRRLYDCASVEHGERGLVFKKATLTARLQPLRFERPQLVNAARALYRLMLDHGVAVEITLVG